MLCPHCGWNNPPDSRYCNQCGAPVSAAAATGERPPADDALSGLQDQVRRLAERIEQLEPQRAPPAPPGQSPRLATPAPSAPSPRLAAVGPYLAFPTTLGATWLGRARLMGEAARQPLTRDSRALLALAAAVGGLLLLVLLGPWLWDPGLVTVRRELNRIPVQLGLLAAVALVGAVVLGVRGRERAGWRALVPDASVVLALALATIGEGLLLGNHGPPGVACYLAAAAVALWRAYHAAPLAVPGAGSFLLRYEVPLVLLVLAVGAFTRLVLIGQYPYGIEGDEAMWTWNIFDHVVAGETGVWPAADNIRWIPVTYWTEATAFRLFGATVLTARVLVALLSLAGNVAFYFLARRVASVPVALVATFLLGVSIADVSASRLADPEGQIKLWMTLAPMFLVWAVDTRRPLLFFLCGLSLVGGMFTYDTYHPMSAVVGLYLGWAMLRERQYWREWAVGLALFALPILIATPQVLLGISLRQGAYTGVGKSAGVSFPPSAEVLQTFFGFVSTNFGDLLMTLFIRQRWNDFLVNREGAMINAALLPFMVLGFCWALARWRERHNLLLVLWLVLAYFPVSMLIGSVWIRVLYPALPVFYLLAAIGLWWTYQALRATTLPSWQPRLAAGLLSFLGLVGLFNTYIYFREVRDFDDRKYTRELSDELTAALGPGQMVYVAYQPRRGDALETHRSWERFLVRSKVGIGNEDQHYRYITYRELLPRMALERGDYQQMHVVAEGQPRDLGHERQDALAALPRCFPSTTVRQGRYVAVYTVPAEGLANATCSFGATARLVQPPNGATVAAGQPLELRWSLDQGQPSEYRLTVDQYNDGVLPIEAEQFSKNDGWFTETRYVDGFMGDGFLADNINAGQAIFPLQVPVAGRYDVWVRTYRRVMDDTHVYLRVGDREPVEIAKANGANLNRWVWESAGRFDLPAGGTQLTISKDFGTVPHISMFVDALYASRDPSFDPNGRGLWDPRLDTGPLPGSATSYRWDVPVEPGRYRWLLQLLDGDRLVDSLGQPGIATPYQEFQARP